MKFLNSDELIWSKFYLHVNAGDERRSSSSHQRISAAQTGESQAEHSALDELEVTIDVIFGRTNLSEKVKEKSGIVVRRVLDQPVFVLNILVFEINPLE